TGSVVAAICAKGAGDGIHYDMAVCDSFQTVIEITSPLRVARHRLTLPHSQRHRLSIITTLRRAMPIPAEVWTIVLGYLSNARVLADAQFQNWKLDDVS